MMKISKFFLKDINGIHPDLQLEFDSVILSYL